MTGIMMGSTLGSSVSGVLTGFIIPVAELQAVVVLATVGAFICGISGIVLVRLLEEPCRPASPRETDVLTAAREAELPEELRRAA